MSGEKKVFAHFTIKDRGGDLSKDWYVQYYSGSKRIRKREGINQHTTRKARLAAAKKLIKKIKAEGRRVSRIEEKLNDYIAEQVHWEKKTTQSRQSMCNRLFGFLDGRPISQELLESFFSVLKKRLHPTTYNKYIMTLKMLLKEVGYDMYFDDIKYLKAYSTPDKYYQKHQADMLIKELDNRGDRLGLFIRFIYFCALRPRREVRLLRAGDILLEDRKIRIPGVVAKNDKTQFVAIPDNFMPHLKFVYKLSPGDLLFPSRNNRDKAISYNTLYTMHKEVLKKMRFGSGYTVYSWKHTGAVLAAKAGATVLELKIHLRHHSLDETYRYLRQLGIEDLDRLCNIFPDIG